MSAWDANHPICTLPVPTKARDWFPIASWSAFTRSLSGFMYLRQTAGSTYCFFPFQPSRAIRLPFLAASMARPKVHAAGPAIGLLKRLHGPPAFAAVLAADAVAFLHVCSLGKSLVWEVKDTVNAESRLRLDDLCSDILFLGVPSLILMNFVPLLAACLQGCHELGIFKLGSGRITRGIFSNL